MLGPVKVMHGGMWRIDSEYPQAQHEFNALQASPEAAATCACVASNDVEWVYDDAICPLFERLIR